MRQVFISYSSKEADQANEIVKALEAQGIQCWIAPRDIGIGSNYMRAIPGGIKECPYFLLVLSGISQDSVWVEKELGQAIKQRKEILPLMIENCAICDVFDFALDNVQIRPYYRDRDATIRELITLIQRNLPQSAPAPKPAEPSVEECYQKGERAYYFKNYEEAVKWYRKAAEKGYCLAQRKLGWCYDQGHGVPKDYANAAFWYREAAEQGDADAQFRLGYFCDYGNIGPQNPTIAAEWYLKSAEQGFAYGQLFLGILYENGRGVKKDLTEARKWYQKAAEQGNEDAKKRLENLK